MKLEHGHTRDSIRDRLTRDKQANYLRDFIYGGLDGVITTFVIIAGSVGATISSPYILILGIVNLLGDGFSMAASSYSGAKSELDEYRHVRAIEKRHIEQVPEGEREEVREIFRQKGLDGEDLEQVTRVFTSDKERWINIMLTEEYGLSPVLRKPWISGTVTFAAFVACGALPLLPFALNLPAPFIASMPFAVAVFFMIGTIKSRWSPAHWWISALETVTIGCLAALMAYLLGDVLAGLLIDVPARGS